MSVSLCEHLGAREPELPWTVVSKAAMLHVTRVVEAVAADSPGHALVIACQHERFWRMSRSVYVGAGLDPVVVAVPSSRASSTGWVDDMHVALPDDHPLVDEWVVIVLGPDASVLLCGHDQDDVRAAGPVQGAREFNTAMTTDARIVRETLAHLVSDDRLQFSDAARASMQPGDGPTATTDRMLAEILRRADDAETAKRAWRDRWNERSAGIRDRERQRIVGAVHDGSLQHLLAAAQDLEELEDTLGPEGGVAELRTALRDGIAQLRAEITDTLEASTAGSMHAQLDELADHYGRRGGFDAAVSVDEQTQGLRDDTVIACVRELLLNVAKHARATSVDVTVSRSGPPDQILIEVVDDGIGISTRVLELAREDGHLGLTLTRSRIEDAGGTWSMTTAPGRGVSIRATIPLAFVARPPFGVSGSDADGPGTSAPS